MAFMEQLLSVLAILLAVSGELTCPEDHECDCSVQKGTEDTIHVECNALQLEEMPDLTAFKDMPISLLLLEANDITKIPPDAFAGLTFKGEKSDSPATIDLSENPLITLHEHTFRGIQGDNIRLRILNCSLKTFPKKALQEITNLTSLYIQENDMKDLPKKPFKMLSNLEIVDLSSNNIKKLPEDTFEGLESILKYVYLQGMGLVQFPSKALARLTNLQEVELEDNRIVQLGDHILKDFKTKKGLTLKINKNRLGKVSKEAFGNTKVEILRLNLHFNRLTSLNWTSVCPSAFTSRTTIDVLGNPIQCDCTLYSIISKRPFHIQGECDSEVDTNNKYNGYDISVRKYSDVTDFMEVAKEECANSHVGIQETCGSKSLTPQIGLVWSTWLAILLFIRRMSAC